MLMRGSAVYPWGSDRMSVQTWVFDEPERTAILCADQLAPGDLYDRRNMSIIELFAVYHGLQLLLHLVDLISGADNHFPFFAELKEQIQVPSASAQLSFYGVRSRKPHVLRAEGLSQPPICFQRPQGVRIQR